MSKTGHISFRKELPSRKSMDREKTLTVYLIFFLLVRMRHCLGLEAMLEFLEAYVHEVGCVYPEMNAAVRKRAETIDAQGIYQLFV